MRTYGLNPEWRTVKNTMEEFSKAGIISGLIVLILMLILAWPTLTSTDTLAREAGIQANMSHIKSALMRYYHDNGHYPIAIGCMEVNSVSWNSVVGQTIHQPIAAADPIWYTCRNGQSYQLSD